MPRDDREARNAGHASGSAKVPVREGARFIPSPCGASTAADRAGPAASTRLVPGAREAGFLMQPLVAA